jgi:hypothetical protein
MKLYKITINNPDKNGLKEMTISEKMLNQLAPLLNEKKILKIGDGYINTSYIVVIEPDVEAMKLEDMRLKSIADAKQLMSKECKQLS